MNYKAIVPCALCMAGDYPQQLLTPVLEVPAEPVQLLQHEVHVLLSATRVGQDRPEDKTEP